MHVNRAARLLFLPIALASLAMCVPFPPDETSGAPSKSSNDTSARRDAGPAGAGSDEAEAGAGGGGAGPAEEPVDGSAPAGPRRTIDPACAGEPFDVARVRKDLAYLASPELAGRAPGSAGDAAARRFIEERFRCLGLQPGGDGGTFYQRFTDSEGNESSNLIGLLPGSDPALKADVIVVGAHRDHFGRTDQDECEGLCLGANDNASGTTTVLALALALRQRAVAPKRTIAFVLFSSEELGCEGSHRFVDNGTTAVSMARVVYDVNFDMVGSYTQWNRRVVAHGTVGNTPGAALIKPLVTASGLNVTTGVPGIEEDDSDYYPFCAAGIPMVSFFTHDPACYHASCDTVDKIDFTSMAKIAKIGADLTAGLADATTDLAAYRRGARASQLGCTGFPNPADEDDE